MHAVMVYSKTNTLLTAFFRESLGKPAPERLNQSRFLMKQEMMGWQYCQWDHMQIICTSLQTANHATISSLNFFRPDAPRDMQPTVSKHWRQMVHSNTQTHNRFTALFLGQPG